MHNPTSVLENDTRKLQWYFDIQTDHLISVRQPDLIKISKKWELVDFDFPVDHWVKSKENEKKGKYLNFAKDLKKQWNMKVTGIPIVIDALGTITEELVKGLEDLEITWLLHYWDQQEYWEESWRLQVTCCHLNSRERPSANPYVKKNRKVVNNHNNNFFAYIREF